VTPPGLRDRRHRDGRTGLAGTRRGTSTTINYVLAIGIVTLLVSVLLIGSASILDDQRQSAVRTQLEGVGNRMAAEIVAVDRLSRSGGDVNVSVDRPDEVGGTGYHVELVSSPGGTCGAPTCLELTAPETDTTVSVPVGNVTPVTVERIGDRWLITSSRSATGARETARADVELNVNPSIGVAREVDTSPPIGRAINIVNEKPLAGFTFTPGTPGVGRQVTFRNDTDDIDGTVTNFSWDFTDNGSFERTGPAENVTNFTYSEPGRYDARLQVTDNDGDTGNATKRIVVSGVVYERDAVAAEYDDPADKPGGVRFNVTNQFTSGSDFDPTVTLEQLTVNPENATSYRLLEGDDGSDGIDTEVLVETSTDTETVEYNNGAGGKTLDTTAGTDIPTSGSLDVELTAGDSAYFQLNEFKDQFENSINASKETYEMTLKYRVNESGTSELYYYRFTVQPDPVGTATPSPGPGPSPPTGGTVLYRVNAGGPTVSASSGPDWEDDQGGSGSTYSSGGTTYDSGLDAGEITDPTGAPTEVFESERYGDHEWEFGVTAGNTYQVRLYFAEIFHAPGAGGSGDDAGGSGELGDREFNLTIEGDQKLSEYDIVEDVGTGAATVKNYTVTPSDGTIDIDFDTVTDNAKVSAIEIRKAAYPQTGNNDVVIEAESYTGYRDGISPTANSEWVERTSSAASGNTYMLATPETTSDPGDDSTTGARLDYAIDFDSAGTYRVYTRLKSPDGGSNSVHVGIDSNTPASYDGDTNGGHDTDQNGDWRWVDDSRGESSRTEIDVSSPGVHTVHVWAREGGIQFDKIVLTKTGGRPSGTGPTPIAAIDPANAPPLGTRSGSAVPQSVTRPHSQTGTWTVSGAGVERHPLAMGVIS
jgi:hypothetical protein